MNPDLLAALRPLQNHTLVLISPAGAVNAERARRANTLIRQAGIETVLMPHTLSRHRYLAGTLEQRLEDLHAAWARDDTAAVWCLRGGYGSAQLVTHIDWSRIGRAPLIGYSDISALLEVFRRHGRQAIHAPVATSLALAGNNPGQRRARVASVATLATAIAGRAGGFPVRSVTGSQPSVAGVLVGGNLTTLASLAGTAAALQLDAPAILMLEDVGEAEYRLERSFHQLLSSLDTTRLAAVCLGSFERCFLADAPGSLERIVAEWLAPLGVPLYADAPFGHGDHNHAWPCGRRACIDGEYLRWEAV